MAHSRLNTSLLAITSCLLWSTAFAGVKAGLEYTTPLHFAGTRFFIAGVLVFPLAYRYNPRYFRIIRDNLNGHHVRILNLFPAGEGAGYAGGIVSSAIDGERAAEHAARCMQ